MVIVMEVQGFQKYIFCSFTIGRYCEKFQCEQPSFSKNNFRYPSEGPGFLVIKMYVALYGKPLLIPYHLESWL